MFSCYNPIKAPECDIKRFNSKEFIYGKQFWYESNKICVSIVVCMLPIEFEYHRSVTRTN